MFPKKYIFILIFFAAVLLCGKEAHAATEFVSTIRATGGDYSLLSTWEAAVQSNLTASTTVVYSGTGTGGISAGATLELFRGGEYQNITALKIATTSSQLLVQTFTGSYKVLQNSDQWRVASSTNNMWTVSSAGLGDSAIAVAECYNDWPTGLNNYVTISGWTTGASNYVKVYAPESERHNGIPGTGFKIYTSTGNHVINIAQAYTKISGIEVQKLGGAGNAVWSGVSYTEIDHCIFRNTIGTAVALWFGTAGCKFSNNLVYGSAGTGIYLESTVYLYNCTFVNNNTGLYENNRNRSYVIKNSLFRNITQDIKFNDVGVASVNYSASSDATADNWGGTGNRINQTFSFVDEANDDFHLSSSDSGAKNQGADLSADASYPITDDIDYQTRPYGGIWDIGADETPSSAFKFNSGTFKIRGTIKFE